MNLNYFWQRKKDKQQQQVMDPWTESFKRDRKTLSKKLNALRKQGEWIHEMDEDMFNAVCGMLDSESDSDIELAREIIFNSKIGYQHIIALTNNYKYCDLLLYGSDYTRPPQVRNMYYVSSSPIQTVNVTIQK